MRKKDLYKAFFQEVSSARNKEDIHAVISRYTGRIGLDSGKIFLQLFNGLSNNPFTLEEQYMLASVLTARMGAFEGDGEELWHEIAFSMAEHILEKLPSVPGIEYNLYILLTLADLCRNRTYGDHISNIQMALHYFKETTELGAPTNDRKWAVSAWVGLGECYDELSYLQVGNYYQEEIFCYEQALSLVETPSEKVDILIRLAVPHQNQETQEGIQAAFQCYQEALNLLDSSNDSELYTKARANLGVLYWTNSKELNDSKKLVADPLKCARECFEEALSCNMELDERARTLGYLAQVYTQLADGDHMEHIKPSLALMQEAVSIWEGYLHREVELISLYRDIGYQYEIDLGDLKSAEQWYMKAFHLLQEQLSSTENIIAKMRWNTQGFRVYQGLVRSNIGQHKEKEAFYMAASSRARIINELVGRRHTSPHTAITQTLWEHFQKKRSCYVEAVIAYNAAQNQRAMSGGRLAVLRRRQEKAATEYQQVLDVIGEKSLTTARILKGEPLTLDDIRASLGPHQALLVIYPTQVETFAFVVRSQATHPDLQILSLAQKGVEDLMSTVIFDWITEYEDYRNGLFNEKSLQRLRDSLSDMIEYFSEALNLYKILPVLDGVTHVLLVPHYPLQFVPLHALIVEQNRSLLDIYDLSFLPSINLLAVVQTIPIHQTRNFFGVSNPRPYPPWHLSYSACEVHAVASFFEDITLLEHEQANREQVIKEIGNAHIVHMSCHGVHSIFGEAFQSALLLAQNQVLQVEDAFDELEDLDISIVVLSACERMNF